MEYWYKTGLQSLNRWHYIFPEPIRKSEMKFHRLIFRAHTEWRPAFKSFFKFLAPQKVFQFELSCIQKGKRNRNSPILDESDEDDAGFKTFWEEVWIICDDISITCDDDEEELGFSVEKVKRMIYWRGFHYMEMVSGKAFVSWLLYQFLELNSFSEYFKKFTIFNKS